MTGKGNRPILILAALFVVASSLAWYFSWFGRELSDADISKYLADEKNPRHVQHALLQIQQRMEKGDGSAKNWYPQLIKLSGNLETEYRLTEVGREALERYLDHMEALIRAMRER